MIRAGIRPPSRADLARRRDELSETPEAKDEPRPEGEGLPAPRRPSDDAQTPAEPVSEDEAG
jgi:hypothetical protein